MEPTAWMFTNSEGDADFGNNLPALRDKSFQGGPIVPLYAIPEGWGLMPKEPNEEMLFTYIESVRGGREPTWMDAIRKGYMAMFQVGAKT